MVVNRCINCGSRVFDDGFCGEVNCNSYYSQWDMTCAPAQEEKEMGKVCEKHQIRSLQGEPCGSCAADLRERWDSAFYAALGGNCACQNMTDENAVKSAATIANETIRRHADMMASRDKLIAEVVG